jgi:hypothetical protein
MRNYSLYSFSLTRDETPQNQLKSGFLADLIFLGAGKLRKYCICSLKVECSKVQGLTSGGMLAV